MPKTKRHRVRTVGSDSQPEAERPLVKIKVVGIGGGGGNAVTRMSHNFTRGVDFVAINTDIQDLEYCDAKKKIHIGRLVTKGIGAGMNPDLGRQAAEENRAEIADALKDADLVFLTAGFGGGTGTGALPVVADIVREETDALSIAVITKPFSFEGTQRMQIAEEGLARVKDRVDALITIPNDRIFSIIDNDTPVIKAFEKIDEILKSAVQGVAEIIASAGLVNVDFADVRAIVQNAGPAIIGVGVASGPDRAVKAMSQAVDSPLLEHSIEGAKGVLFGIAGGRDLKMSEINDAAKIVNENVDSLAKIIFGAYHDRKLKAGKIKIILIATGFNGMVLHSEPDSMNLFAPTTVVNKTMPLIDSSKEENKVVEDKEAGPESKDAKLKKVFDRDNKKDDDIWDIPAFLRKRKH
ncbi:MAG: cell division protein FtsZ [Patescibacteria group bacterium]|nr:cell division protein FtsZ [Patescibacteria group bacterium]MCL5224362.1 cell division protein FtsZ [Patescibacteria group bacterium]